MKAESIRYDDISNQKDAAKLVSLIFLCLLYILVINQLNAQILFS